MISEILDVIIEELEELKGEEFTLSDMDNTIKEIIDAVGDHKNSIFDGETKEYIEKGEYSYSVWADEEEIETKDICVYFEVLEENEDNLEVIIKVTDIELL
ncbi:hypothetical protein NE686_17615 [Tissierella carlieri]|uniref:Uncharacterized protein n=1 Tax=Tissierella carlieri TaxID=689904 RepID=A0ABT1SEL1_9FIRM|nr:hypothetical protein [Tissierella carlieri]MCQ4924924.1 hypothetical protein [Tissierella carlieri]